MKILFILAVGLYFLFLIAGKRLKSIEIYSGVFSSLYIALAFDAFFKGKHKLYYYGSDAGVHYIDFFFRLSLYPLSCLILLKLVSIPRTRFVQFILIISWALIWTMLEWGLLKADVIKYDGWKIYYSTLKYLFIYSLVYFNGQITKKLAMKKSM